MSISFPSGGSQHQIPPLQESAIKKTSEEVQSQTPEVQSETVEEPTIGSGFEKVVAFAKGEQSGINKDTLKKISVLATEIITSSSDSSAPSIYFPVQTEHHTYHLGFDKNKKEIEMVFIDKIIASGNYGEIRVLTNILSKNTEVVKQAKGNIEAQKDVQNEFTQINFIHEKGARWGLQAKPRQVIHIKETGSEPDESIQHFGYIGAKYDGDYEKALSKELTVDQGLSDFHQILSGGSQLHSLNVLHGDLKPANLLVKNDSDGSRLVHLADLGGARAAEKCESLNELSIGVFTPQYSPIPDLDASDEFVQQGDRAGIITVEKARDVFALGNIIQFALTGSPSYEIGFDKHPVLYTDYTKETAAYTEITRTDIPEGLKTLLKNMQDPDYTKRPTAEEALKTYEEILKKDKSELYSAIQEKIKKDYPGTATDEIQSA